MSILNIIKSLSKERVLREGKKRKVNIHHLTPKHRKWYETTNLQRKLAEEGDVNSQVDTTEPTKKKKESNRSTVVDTEPVMASAINNR